jgi:hypothetical protein
MTKRKRPTKTTPKRQNPAHVSQQRFLQRTTVYLMGNIPYFWKCKFGISDHAKARRKNVSETTPGYVFSIATAELEFGWHLEQFVHRVYGLQNSQFGEGSGRTEWFLSINPVFGSLFWLCSERVCPGAGLEFYALAYFTPLIWMDGLLWLLVFSVLRLVLAVGLLVGISYMFSIL